VTRLAGVRFGAPPFYGFSLGIDPDARECRRRRRRRWQWHIVILSLQDII